MQHPCCWITVPQAWDQVDHQPSTNELHLNLAADEPWKQLEAYPSFLPTPRNGIHQHHSIHDIDHSLSAAMKCKCQSKSFKSVFQFNV